MLDDKEIIVNANLQDIPAAVPLKKYSFYAGMLVGASIEQVRQVITNYSLYSKLIPYVDRAQYSEKDHRLKIEGGIWSFKLRSEVLFKQVMNRWVHYQIVDGHFSGLEGDIYFESLGEKGSAVYFTGEQIGKLWPPKFVIERGAEIVFEFTARKMRSYIESEKRTDKGAGNGKQQELPQPRGRL